MIDPRPWWEALEDAQAPLAPRLDEIAGLTAPDLQALVRDHGGNGYTGIPAEAWAEFDYKMARWNAERRFNYKR